MAGEIKISAAAEYGGQVRIGRRAAAKAGTGKGAGWRWVSCVRMPGRGAKSDG